MKTSQRLVLALSIIAPFVAADDIHVPGDAPTIQAGNHPHARVKSRAQPATQWDRAR